jgi:hypothetical protein
MRTAPAVLIRLLCLLAAFCLASCKTGDYHYGKAAFTLPKSFSRIHSPGALTALGRDGHDPEMFMVIRATHNEDPFKFSDAEWDRAGDAALKAMNADRSFSNAREISRNSGYQSGFRTMDHVMAGSINSFGYVSSNAVISSRLFHSRDEAYYFALAQFRSAHSKDPARFSRIMSTVRFE